MQVSNIPHPQHLEDQTVSDSSSDRVMHAFVISRLDVGIVLLRRLLLKKNTTASVMVNPLDPRCFEI